MTEDASFADGGEKPLRLHAVDVEDLKVLSALIQDAVFPVAEMAYRPKERRFALLLNRFRWEDAPKAEQRKRPFERVQTMLTFDDVMGVRSQGVSRDDAETVLSVLAVDFEAGEDGTGVINLTLAGDGAIALDVETIEAQLRDVTRPYVAPSKSQPKHPD
ncbi:MAG: DUF2948 family protein [Planktomarina sp.]